MTSAARMTPVPSHSDTLFGIVRVWAADAYGVRGSSEHSHRLTPGPRLGIRDSIPAHGVGTGRR